MKHPPLKYLLLAGVMLLSILTRAQRSVEQELTSRLRAAKTDSSIILTLGQLSDYYYANRDFARGDSLIEKQIMVAEATMKPSLILLTYFTNAGFRSTGSNTKDRSQNIKEYIERAIEYARLNNYNDFLALGYANLSALYLTDGKVDEAFRMANLSFTTALNTESDSAKVLCGMQLGYVYLERSDILMAFRTFTNASNIANDDPTQALLSPVYHGFAILYKKLGKAELARNYTFRSLAINKKNGDVYGQINDHIFLAKLSNYAAGKNYLQQAIAEARSIQNVSMLIEAERILFSYMLLKETPPHMMAYLDQQAELKNVFANTGPGYLDWMLAEIHLYGHELNDALVYFKKAEPYFENGYDLKTQKNFYGEYASCLQEMNNNPLAIQYFQRAYDLAHQSSDLSSLAYDAGVLRDLYQQQSQFQEAFNYSLQYDHYKDSLDLLGRERDLALMEIKNEEGEQQRLAEVQARNLQRKHNLQYMLITIVIATAFVVIIMIGMFKVSTFTIRLMGFLSLIFLFEFIILLLDTKIHHFTHGDPWKIWLIKIVIISMLLPLHHYLEHKLIHYLMSRHLIKLRKQFAVASFLRKKKRPVPVGNGHPEEAPVNTGDKS